MVPDEGSNTMAMLCFLLAMACSFVAGTVYGMESEAERHASQVVEFEDLNDEVRDLEKGQWEHEEYSEKDAYPYYDNPAFPYTPVEAYSDVPLTSSLPSESPTGDPMTGLSEGYYPSTSETEDVESQANAHHTILSRQTRQQIPGRSSLELHLSKRACQHFPFDQLPAIQCVSFATRKLAQEKERLKKQLEEIGQGRIKENREKVKKELARLARNRAVKKENEEEGLRCVQAGKDEGADLSAQLAAVLDTAAATATAMGPYTSVGSGVIQGSQSGFDAESGEGVTKDDVWFD